MRLVLVTAMLLVGCDDIPQGRTKSEIHDIALDVADDVATQKASALESRIEELESKLESAESEKALLEADISMLQRRTDVLYQRDDADTANINQLFKNDETFSQRLNIPFQR